MNRQANFNFIEQQLCFLAYRIEVRGSLNILDLNLHSENFYQHLFNLIFDWHLKNLNTVQQNSAGIDLVDRTNKLIIQVSATATKQKIESALAKDLSDFAGYTFKFISISKNATNLRTKTFSNPHNLIFLPSEDIFDISYLLKHISNLDINQQNGICEFLKKELKNNPDPNNIELNLTRIIMILSNEDWNHRAMSYTTEPYDIERKILYNHLNTARVLIDEYKIHYNRLEKIYSDFDKQGLNKSFSILNGIRTEYLALGTNITADQCFFSIIDKVAQKIRASANYTSIPDEELVLCVQILVVDAFIRCKIFKNPEGNAGARS